MESFDAGDGAVLADLAKTNFDVLRVAPIAEFFAVELRAAIHDDVLWSGVIVGTNLFHSGDNIIGSRAFRKDGEAHGSA